jgi:hypothetical protein
MAKKTRPTRVHPKSKPKRNAPIATGWIVVAQPHVQNPQHATYYVKAATEQEAKRKVKESYILEDDTVLMIAGKLTDNASGILEPRFGDDDILAADAVNLFEVDE